MTDDGVRAKVRERDGRKGRFLWAPDARVAIETYRATRCKHPADPA
jgi:hypothetical protein